MEIDKQDLFAIMATLLHLYMDGDSDTYANDLLESEYDQDQVKEVINVIHQVGRSTDFPDL